MHTFVMARQWSAGMLGSMRRLHVDTKSPNMKLRSDSLNFVLVKNYTRALLMKISQPADLMLVSCILTKITSSVDLPPQRFPITHLLDTTPE